MDQVMVNQQSEAERFFGSADGTKAFFAHDGTVFTNIPDLMKSMPTMEEHVFLHHVNNEKNDFARWIYDVIGDTTLALRLQGARTKEETIAVMQERAQEIGEYRLPPPPAMPATTQICEEQRPPSILSRLWQSIKDFFATSHTPQD